MKLQYTTGKLPPNFFYLGILLLGIGAWRLIVLDWKGIVLLFFSLGCLFIRTGIIIDTNQNRFKKYVGLFALKRGHWKALKPFDHLHIMKTRESVAMSTASITRTEKFDVYKLMASSSDQELELMSGEKDLIIKRAKEIASSLGMEIT